MLRDYSLSSPSLDGILSHDSIVYEGLNRPNEIIRVFDRATLGGQLKDIEDPEKRKVLQQYFYDLYGLIIRKIAQINLDQKIDSENELKIQAMLQELFKVKKLLEKGKNE